VSQRALLAPAMTMACVLGLAHVAAGAPAGGSGSAAAPADDYDPHSTAWNGLASFVALTEGMGFDVSPVSSLEWSDLDADDVLVLIYPLERVDPGRLGAFIQAGGNAIIADDFGEGKEAMAALGLLRADSVTPRAATYAHDRLWAPIAARHGDHPIAADVGEVVTNHPAALTHIEGATAVIGFDEGTLIAAGERGTGRFVAVADPSIFINCMQRYRGDVQIATNMLRWLDRDGAAHHLVLLRGDVPMYGDPRPFIDDANAGAVGHSIHDLDDWLAGSKDWLLTPVAMRAVAGGLALVLLVLAISALPIRRGPRIDGAWLRFDRPPRKDDPHELVDAADHRGGNAALLVTATVLRDHAQAALARTTGRAEPLYTMPEAELVAAVAGTCGTGAGVALTRVYRRLRALPSRSQASAPWGAGQMARRDFDALYRDVAELCRTLGDDSIDPANA
jgi:hypothetical protein